MRDRVPVPRKLGLAVVGGNLANQFNSSSKVDSKVEGEAGDLSVEDMVAVEEGVHREVGRLLNNIMVGLLNTSKVGVLSSTNEEVHRPSASEVVLLAVGYLHLVGLLWHQFPSCIKQPRLLISLG